MNLEKKFKKSLDEKWYLRFKTTHPEKDAYDGIVTHIKKDFIAIREEADFEFDGIEIFPKSSIKEIRDGKYDKCGNEIIRFNGTIKKLRPPRWLDPCETLPAVIAYMKEKDIWPGIEILFNKEKDSAFYIGPITKYGKKNFTIRCYDAAGKWEKQYELEYAEIFRIVIDNKYCKNFNAFMRAKSK
jgi:hypothetical protein